MVYPNVYPDNENSMLGSRSHFDGCRQWGCLTSVNRRENNIKWGNIPALVSQFFGTDSGVIKLRQRAIFLKYVLQLTREIPLSPHGTKHYFTTMGV